MKVAYFAESPADQAALTILTEAILRRTTESVSYIGLRHRGWPTVKTVLPAVLKEIHYHTDAQGFVFIVDSNGSPPHLPAHDSPNPADPKCRLCQLRGIAEHELRSVRARASGSALKIAIGLAVPAIEAWLLCGVDPHVTEAAWINLLKESKRGAMPYRGNLPDAVIEKVKIQLDSRTWTTGTRFQLSLLSSDRPFVDAHLQGNVADVRRHFHVKVRNWHHRRAAQNCYAYVEGIQDVKTGTKLLKHTIEFKWAGTLLPSVRIAPDSDRLFDAFHVMHSEPRSACFNALTDSSDYMPHIPQPGEYEITYAVASENFPIARGRFLLTLGNQIDEVRFAPITL